MPLRAADFKSDLGQNERQQVAKSARFDTSLDAKKRDDSPLTHPLGSKGYRDGPGEPGAERSGGDPLEVALARALVLASEAGEWGVVSELARQLEVRRRERRAPDVVDLDRARERKDRER
jgi:hypothetical protein